MEPNPRNSVPTRTLLSNIYASAVSEQSNNIQVLTSLFAFKREIRFVLSCAKTTLINDILEQKSITHYPSLKVSLLKNLSSRLNGLLMKNPCFILSTIIDPETKLFFLKLPLGIQESLQTFVTNLASQEKELPAVPVAPNILDQHDEWDIISILPDLPPAKQQPDLLQAWVIEPYSPDQGSSLVYLPSEAIVSYLTSIRNNGGC